jgi:hypothetical protein
MSPSFLRVLLGVSAKRQEEFKHRTNGYYAAIRRSISQTQNPQGGHSKRAVLFHRSSIVANYSKGFRGESSTLNGFELDEVVFTHLKCYSSPTGPKAQGTMGSEFKGVACANPVST